METDESQIHKHDGTKTIPEAGVLGKAIGAVSHFFSISILVSAGILIVEVFLRYVFNAPTIWGHETVVFLTASSFIFGGLFVAARDSHIRVVLIYDVISAGVKRWFNVVISAFCALASFFFTLSTWAAVERALFTPGGKWRIETSGTAFNAPYPGLLRGFLFIILLVLTLQFIILTVNYARKKVDD